MCLLIEYLEYKAWHRGFYGPDDDVFLMDYASFLDDFTRMPYGAGFWRD